MTKSVFISRFSQEEIQHQESHYKSMAHYYWEHYHFFAYQRSLILDDLKHTLACVCRPFSFSKWQRVVDFKYALMPLSAKGSVLNDPGGRFNIGDIDKTKFPHFAALYIAENRDTAYKEKFALGEQKGKHDGLTAEELALTRHTSISIVALKGEVSLVIDLTCKDYLKDFFDLVEKIKLPDHLVEHANQLKINPLLPAKTIQELLEELLQPNWRDMPMRFDIPAYSQIFGQIACLAGVEAILYPSKITGKKCLAIFPENFTQSDSFIEIMDGAPVEMKHKRLDANSCLSSHLTRSPLTNAVN